MQDLLSHLQEPVCGGKKVAFYFSKTYFCDFLLDQGLKTMFFSKEFGKEFATISLVRNLVQIFTPKELSSKTSS